MVNPFSDAPPEEHNIAASGTLQVRIGKTQEEPGKYGVK
jgi:hypothetical protein